MSSLCKCHFIDYMIVWSSLMNLLGHADWILDNKAHSPIYLNKNTSLLWQDCEICQSCRVGFRSLDTALRIICRLFCSKALPAPQFYQDKWLQIIQESCVTFSQLEWARMPSFWSPSGRPLREKVPQDRLKENRSWLLEPHSQDVWMEFVHKRLGTGWVSCKPRPPSPVPRVVPFHESTLSLSAEPCTVPACQLTILLLFLLHMGVEYSF